jgi:hypothetical protein
MVLPRVRRAWVPAALAAGAAGAIALDAFLLTAHWAGVAYVGPVEHYTFIASALAGPAALGAPWAVPLGIVAHFVVAIGWAFGYLSAAQYQPQLLRRPFTSGFIFGIVVWIVMVLLLIPIGKYQPPTIHSFDRDIIAHTLFFGIPLAYVAARLTRNG